MKKKNHKIRVEKRNRRLEQQFWAKVNQEKEKWQNGAMLMIEENAVKMILNGVIIAATGSGKTRLQCKLILRFIRQTKGFGIIVVKSPRIQLTQQLTKEVQKYLIGKKNDGELYQQDLIQFYTTPVMFHSGDDLDLIDKNELKGLVEGSKEYNEKKKELLRYAQEVKASTSKDELKNYIVNAQKSNKVLVIQTTYHSFHKICEVTQEMGIEIGLGLNDEAQYLAQKEFHKVFKTCNSKSEYSFTATPTSGNERAIFLDNNEKNLNPIYGEFCFKLTAGNAILNGIICWAKWVEFDLNHNEQEGLKLSHKTILSSFDRMKEDLGRKAKMLATESGVRALKALNKPNSALMKRVQEDPNFHFLTIASSRNSICHNGVIITRSEFMENLAQLSEDPNIDLVVVHYDILSEGIDVPSMDGVVFLRSVSISKFYQILGRCLRRDFGKECGYIICPKYTGDSSMYTQYHKWRENMFDLKYLPMDEIQERSGSSSKLSEDPDPDFKLSGVALDYRVKIEKPKTTQELLNRLKLQGFNIKNHLQHGA